MFDRSRSRLVAGRNLMVSGIFKEKSFKLRTKLEERLLTDRSLVLTMKFE